MTIAFILFKSKEERGENGPRKAYKDYTKSVATLKTIARRDVFKQHFMALPAAMFYNNRLPL